MPTTAFIAETDEGVAELVGNEIVVRDKTSGDPIAWRSRSENGGIAKWSIDARINNAWVEIGYLFAKRNERFPNTPVAEFEFWHRFGNQDIKSLSIAHDGITAHVPLATPTVRAFEIWSPNGLFLTQQQDDGNLVWYRLSVPFDKNSVVMAKLIVGL